MVLSSEPGAKLVVVVGATGAQGGSVINHLIASDKPYRLRGITRDASKPAAQELAKRGVDMVAANVADTEALTEAFKGADVVFGMTRASDVGFNKDAEKALGVSIVDAVHAAHVPLFIWAGLPHVSARTGGKYDALSFFDSKAEVTAYAREKGVPTVNVMPGGYAENFHGMSPIMRQADGSFALALPSRADALYPLLHCARDYGGYVRAAIEVPELGKPGTDVLATSELISYEDLMRQWGEIHGVKAAYVPMTDEQFLGIVPMVAVVHMYRYIQDFGYYFGDDIGPSNKHLATPPHKWTDYAKASDWSGILSPKE